MSGSSSASEWRLRGEGGSSVVIAHTQKPIVYRLIKKKKDDKKKSEDLQKKIENNLSFIENIISPRLSHCFVNECVLVPVTRGFLEDVSQKIQHERAAERLNQVIDLDCPVTLTLPDLCYVLEPKFNSSLPTFSLEIKPKKGYLPTLTFDPTVTWPRSEVCRFCMHQELKLSQKKWPVRSIYCPLDLYSGSRSGMKHALQSLCLTPQNSWRLFRDGELVWGQDVLSTDICGVLNKYFPSNQLPDVAYRTTDEQTCTMLRSVDGFLDIVIECLLTISEAGVRDQTRLPGNHTQQTCKYSCTSQKLESQNKGESLPAECVLSRLLDLQQMCGVSVQGMNSLYQRLQRHLEAHPEHSDLLHLEGPYDPQQWLPDSHTSSRDDDSIDFAVEKIKRFIVSKTVKDCSIMIAIQALDKLEEADLSGDGSSHCHIVKAPGGDQQYQASVSVVDLDPKSWLKIPYYAELDCQMQEHYMTVHKPPLS